MKVGSRSGMPLLLQRQVSTASPVKVEAVYNPAIQGYEIRPSADSALPMYLSANNSGLTISSPGGPGVGEVDDSKDISGDPDNPIYP